MTKENKAKLRDWRFTQREIAVADKFKMLESIRGELATKISAIRNAEDFCFHADDTKQTPTYRDMLAVIRSRSTKRVSGENEFAPGETPVAVKRGRGRPKGSKNKPKMLALAQ